MSMYGRILKYLRPHWQRLALSMLCSILFSIFSGISIYLTIPLLDTLFRGTSSAVTAAPQSPTATVVPDWLGHIKESVSRELQKLVFSDNPEHSLLSICIIIVLAFFLKNLFGYLQSNLMTHVEQGLIRDLRNSLYRHIHELPLAYFTNERTGNLISRVMNDVAVVN